MILTTAEEGETWMRGPLERGKGAAAGLAGGALEILPASEPERPATGSLL